MDKRRKLSLFLHISLWKTFDFTSYSLVLSEYFQNKKNNIFISFPIVLLSINLKSQRKLVDCEWLKSFHENKLNVFCSHVLIRIVEVLEAFRQIEESYQEIVLYIVILR